jgi:hypothetical protein
MGVRQDCRHYLLRTTGAGEAIERCRVGAAAESPFACPDGCVLFEERPLMGGGWSVAPAERMSNTADALAALPPARSRRWGRKKR